MTIKLRGSTDGSVSLSAPADTSPTGTDITLTLPTDAGSANQFLKNSGTAGTLDYSSMVEDSSGNVGIGTTSPDRKLTINSSADADLFFMQSTASANNTSLRFGISGNDAEIHGSGGSSGNLVFKTYGNERMRIDGSGRVGIGTTSPTALLDLEGTSPIIKLTDSDASGTPECQISAAGGDLLFEADRDNEKSNTLIRFFTDGSERMRIDSSGNVYVGKTTTAGDVDGIVLGAGGLFQATRSDSFAGIFNREGSTGSVIEIKSNDSTKGTISVSASAVQYNTTSDYRLKENVVDIADGIARVKQLAPKRFNFIADAETTVDGFLAHEAQAVVPEAITGTHNEVDENGDPVYQGIDQSKLVPLLTAALQEAITKIETLEAKVAALEAA